MRQQQIHIIGAGLSGLAAAVELTHMKSLGKLPQDIDITLHEGSTHAGGRCRSFEDKKLGCDIDNGNHLMMSGNHSLRHYLETIGNAYHTGLTGPDQAIYPFADLLIQKSWRLKLNPSRLPLWMFQADNRVPNTNWRDYLPMLKFLGAKPDQVISDLLPADVPGYEQLWEPLILGVMNAEAHQASAILMKQVIRETFMRGGKQCRPLIAAEGLSDLFVDPALEHLAKAGVKVRFSHRLREISFNKDQSQLKALHFAGSVTGETIHIHPQDHVIFALPVSVMSAMMPDQDWPVGTSPILNIHYRLPEAYTLPADFCDGATTENSCLRPAVFFGMVGTVTQWVFLKQQIASVTVSAAEYHMQRNPAELADEIWQEVSKGMALTGAVTRADGQAYQPLAETPPYRIVREKRATFLQTPENVAKRPATQGVAQNMYLAGDWTDTALPCTIEGSLRSGQKAADIVVKNQHSLKN